MMPAAFDPPVEVRDCASRGLGVFATRDIAAEEIVTFYAGHVVGLRDVGFLCFGVGLFDSHAYSLNGDPRCLDPRACGQLVNDAHAFAVTRAEADAFWEVPSQATLLEHRKEPVMLDMRAEYWIEAMAHIAQYTAVSLERQNAEFGAIFGPGDSIVACVYSSKAIKAGEEVFMSYGPTYWLWRSLGISDLTVTPTNFHYDVVADAQKVLSGQDSGCRLPGPQMLPSIIARFARLEEFQTRVNGDKFFRSSFELLQRAAADSWVDGKNCFDAREFMREWRAWRDSVVIRD